MQARQAVESSEECRRRPLRSEHHSSPKPVVQSGLEASACLAPPSGIEGSEASPGRDLDQPIRLNQRRPTNDQVVGHDRKSKAADGSERRTESIRATTDSTQSRPCLAKIFAALRARVALWRQARPCLPRSQQDAGGDEGDADSVIE